MNMFDVDEADCTKKNLKKHYKRYKGSKSSIKGAVKGKWLGMDVNFVRSVRSRISDNDLEIISGFSAPLIEFNWGDV